MEYTHAKELYISVVKLKKKFMKYPMLLGVSHQSMIVLRILKNSSVEIGDNLLGMKTSEISKTLKVTKPAITQMINDLEKKGYVERKLTKNDRRVVYVCLTEEGNAFLHQTEEMLFSGLDKLLHKLGEHDTMELIRIFDKLLDIIPDFKCKSNDDN